MNKSKGVAVDVVNAGLQNYDNAADIITTSRIEVVMRLRELSMPGGRFGHFHSSVSSLLKEIADELETEIKEAGRND